MSGIQSSAGIYKVQAEEISKKDFTTLVQGSAQRELLGAVFHPTSNSNGVIPISKGAPINAPQSQVMDDSSKRGSGQASSSGDCCDTWCCCCCCCSGSDGGGGGGGDCDCDDC